MDGFTAVDGDQPVPGTTYFYQVVAAYEVDGTTGAAAPVEFTMPAPLIVAPPVARIRATAGVTSPPPTLAPAGAASRSLLATPTAVRGITVTGTIASATVTWQPVNGAVSYTVTRSTPTNQPLALFPGLTTTTWTDPGPQSLGFTSAGGYGYQVAALLGNGTTVSGQANWTRPNPTCAAPPPNTPMLAILTPTTFQPSGPFPNGAVLTWAKPYYKAGQADVVAYLMERSVSGTNAWTVAATSCGGAIPIALVQVTPTNSPLRFIDASGGIVPNTTYDYRLTAFAANGETGTRTTTWLAPNPPLLHWLPPTIVGSTVTLNLRYESPTANAPPVATKLQFTGPSGLNQTKVGPVCAVQSGCSVTFASVPTGTHPFTVTAQWWHGIPAGGGVTQATLAGSTVVATTTSSTTITVP